MRTIFFLTNKFQLGAQAYINLKDRTWTSSHSKRALTSPKFVFFCQLKKKKTFLFALIVWNLNVSVRNDKGVHKSVWVKFVPNSRLAQQNRVEEVLTRRQLARELKRSGWICVEKWPVQLKLSMKNPAKILDFKWKFARSSGDLTGSSEILLDSVRFPPD